MSFFKKIHEPLRLDRQIWKDAEDSAGLLSERTSEDSPTFGRRRKQGDTASSTSVCLVTFQVLFVGSVVILGLVLSELVTFQNNINNSLLRATSHYAPWFDQLDIAVRETTLNGSLANHPPQIYRMPPSAEVDAAWQRLANTQTTSISSEEARTMGYEPSKLAKFSDDMGLGDDAYVVEIDVFHQIHCLNTLRMNVNFMHYYGDIFPDGVPNAKHIEHVTHCQYALLQNIMCHSDVDAITHRWWDVSHVPLPDFSITKQCRDFDTLLAWQESHTVDLKSYYAMRRPMDYEALVAPEEFKEHYHQTDYIDNDILHPGSVFDDIDWDCYHSSEVRCQGKNAFFNYDYSKADGGRGESQVHTRRWGWRGKGTELQ